jgi:hypothetical protein
VPDPKEPVRSHYTKGEITQLCDVLLHGFLGKQPGMDVFYERLHIPIPVK